MELPIISNKPGGLKIVTANGSVRYAHNIPKKKSVYRSSVTGKIVTKAFALKNPATTYKDTIK